MFKLSTILYRILLTLYPADFRRAYGELMLQLFRDQLRDARRVGGYAWLILWWRTLTDFIVSALAEQRMANPRQPAGWFGVLVSAVIGLTLLLDSRNIVDSALLYALIILVPLAVILRFPVWILPAVGLVLTLPLMIVTYLFSAVIIVIFIMMMLTRREWIDALWTSFGLIGQRIIKLMGAISLVGIVLILLVNSFDFTHGMTLTTLHNVLQNGVSSLAVILVCAPLVGMYGSSAAVVPLMMISTFFASIIDPAYFISELNPTAGEWIWLVSMLPPIILPPLILAVRSSHVSPGWSVAVWALILVFCTVAPAIVRSDTPVAWETAFIVQRAVGALQLTLGLALALVWYDNLSQMRPGYLQLKRSTEN